jgi:nuclear transport factor 2 (NTF2) superfamily protein
MATPNPPVIFPPFNDATARGRVQLAEDAWNTEDPQRRNRDAGDRLSRRIHGYPIAPSERRIALP